MSRLTSRLQAIDRLEEIRMRNVQIRAIATEFGLTTTEVRQELREIERWRKQYGPMGLDELVALMAAEYDLDPEMLRTEAEQIAVGRQTQTAGGFR